MKVETLTQFWVVIMKYSPEGSSLSELVKRRKGRNVYKDFTSDGAETAGRWSREVSKQQMFFKPKGYDCISGKWGTTEDFVLLCWRKE